MLGDVAYNVMIETAPRDHAGAFRWWIDIVPRVAVAAGFELGDRPLGQHRRPRRRGRGAAGAPMKIRVGITIDAPVATTWRVVEPIERHVEWMADAESIRFTGAQTRGVGTAFDCVTKVGPLRLTDRMTVTEWEPGRPMGIEHRGVVTGRGRFTLRRRRGGRTRFTWDERLTFPLVDGRPGRRARGQAGAARDLAP